MSDYKFLVNHKTNDPRNEGYLKGAHALGFHYLRNIIVQDLYFIEGQLSSEELKQLTLKLLSDPVTQTVTWDEMPAPLASRPPEPDTVILEVSLRPGVTDPVAHEIVRAAHELGISGVHRAATGQRFILHFDPSVPVRESVTESVYKLFANPVIQHWKIGSIEPSFPQEVESNGTIEIIPIRNLTDDELLSLSKDRRAAL
ncbi:MAG: phosphoribosylformylglycinamidine synthase subunit PurS, partial [Chloroflexi bacterium]|nr:phosphoribosylformylglycinamidine synthase subunit PurS [Chloroflexota bacterium]